MACVVKKPGSVLTENDIICFVENKVSIFFLMYLKLISVKLNIILFVLGDSVQKDKKSCVCGLHPKIHHREDFKETSQEHPQHLFSSF